MRPSGATVCPASQADRGVFEPIRRQLGVARRVLDVFVAHQQRLQRRRVGEGRAAAMPQIGRCLTLILGFLGYLQRRGVFRMGAPAHVRGT